MTPLLSALPPGWLPPTIAVATAGEYALAGGVLIVLAWLGWRLTRALEARTRELRASEERYRELFQHGIEGVYESRPGGAFVRVNPAMARMFGYASPEEMCRSTPEEVTQLYVSPTRRAEFVRLLGNSDRVTNFESAVRRRDGSTIWISENVRAVRDPAGQLVYLQGFVSDITAHKRAELELRASEVRYRLLFENSPVGIIELNSLQTMKLLEQMRAEGVRSLDDWMTAHPAEARQMIGQVPIVGINTAALRLLAARSVEEVRAALGRIFSAEALEMRRQALLAVWDGRGEIEGETNVTALDGTPRRVYARWWMPEVAGRPRGERTQLALIDLTATRQAEAARQLSETRSRAIFEHPPVALVEFDYQGAKELLAALRAQGVTDLDAYFDQQPQALAAALAKSRLTAMNAAAVQLLGAASKEEVIANRERIFTRDVVGARRSNLLALWRGECRNEGEFTLETLDGRKRRIFHRWWMPEVSDTPGFQWAQTALIDITDIRAAEAALAAERERLAVTLRAMTESVFTADSAGIVLFINDAAGALTGWSPAAAVGRPLADVCVLTDEKSGHPIMAPIATSLVAGQPIDLPPRAVLRPRDGGPRLVEGRCAPIRDVAGRAVGAVLVVHDVTARVRLEEEMVRASKLESVGVLAGGIAHDFNNLLAIVMGNLTLALNDEVTAAAGGRWLKEAERGTLRAKELTQQLLTFARGGDPVRAAVLLPDVVREAAEFALHGASVRCEFDIAGDLRPADADRGQIGQVVQNLVLNAVQAMPQGGVIRLRLHNDRLAAGAVPPLAAGDYVKLSVSDSGHGIAAGDLARIFEPFFTTKEHGTGLGLATVFSVVRKHGGHVAVESQPGAGTVFHLWLPVAGGEPAPAGRSAAPFEILGGRVLFMDDEEPIREMTGALLERLGLRPTMTKDGGEAVKEFALAQMRGEPFDVVIMDLTVPGAMGGAAAMQEILKLDPHARGIVSSGYSSDPVMANFRAHGFRGSVPKPYRMADFTRIVREVLAEP